MKEFVIYTNAKVAYTKDSLRDEFSKQTGIKLDNGLKLILKKRSIDARKGTVRVRLQIELFDSKDDVPEYFEPEFRNVQNSAGVHIIGAGPAGLFAALECISLGFRPIILERGKNVKERRRDLVRITRKGIVNPNSNYCFGAGGAGTFSDGKLYTRSKKKGNVKEVLECLYFFGAPEDILIDAHPHIGTNKLPILIEKIIAFIESCGGEIHFNSSLTELNIEGSRIKSIVLNNKNVLKVDSVLFCTGHSANDIYTLLFNKGIKLEEKPTAIGVRVEHPQKFIDSAQYHCQTKDPFLPAASYKLVAQTSNAPVYSFCMCPGGIIAPCSTEAGEIVTNGWSPSKRNNFWANSGIVVGLDAATLGLKNVLDMLNFRSVIEHKAFVLGGENLFAPAQSLPDFVLGRESRELPVCSYRPGVKSVNLKELFPELIYKALREAFFAFNQKMDGFISEEAIVVGPESRTSSPLRIPRLKETRNHPQIENMFPVGEGAGYAGGIMSAAIDGKQSAAASCKLFMK